MHLRALYNVRHAGSKSLLKSNIIIVALLQYSNKLRTLLIKYQWIIASVWIIFDLIAPFVPETAIKMKSIYFFSQYIPV